MGDTIIGVQFGIANPEEILARGVVEVKTDKTHQGGQPFPGSVFDRRFGAIENGQVCPTCKQTNLLCPGHFGYIRLARPVYLYQFLEIIQKILTIVCLNCSNPYLPDQDLDSIGSTEVGMKRFNVIREETKDFKPKVAKAGTGCPHCGTPMIRKIGKRENKVAVLEAFTYDEEAEPITLQPEMVLRCFQRITDKNVERIGFHPKFSRPDWMICSVLAVPPLTVRPSVIDDNSRSEDDLTHKLIDIVRNNNRLREKIDKGESADMINQYTELLQFDVATYVDNDIKGLPPAVQRSGHPLKTLKARLGAKTGRVRGNLMGKRVDFSARSVITPDANIDLDELGVPDEIAMNLTFPEMVTSFNRDRLMSYVRRGPSNYPGAKSVELRTDKRTINLKYINPDMIDLKEGDVVHRHLIDGDSVLFNRQPSLHKASMMCHRVRVLPCSTFRLNVSATKPYNADFDGDEMNMHVPQSILAATELNVIASILRQIISPRTCSPIIQVFQDTLTGVFRISKDDTSIPEQIAMNMLARTKRPLASFKRTNNPISGKDVISYAFPLINYDGNIKVENGKLVRGHLGGKGGFGNGSILHTIYAEYGPDRAGDFINAIQAIVSKYNQYSAFSTGPSDLIASEEVQGSIKSMLEKGKQNVADVMSDMHAGKFQNISGRSDGEELETRITNALNEINTNVVKAAIDPLPPTNRMIQMSDKGSSAKGTAEMNIKQMMGLLGQQFVEGKRIQYTMDNRTLPHFTKYDDGPESRGFVDNSFISGIRPAEFFFHAMGGREGLIDTAVKTSDTGYIQRKLVKTMEDIHVEHDRTVRDTNGAIVQYMYGEDGIDTTCLETQVYELATMTLEQVYAEFAVKRDQFKEIMSEELSDSPPDMVDQIIRDRDILVKYILRFEREERVVAPVNLKRVIQKFHNSYATKTDLTPEYVVDELNRLCADPSIRPNQLFHMLLRYYLAPKKSMIVHRFTKAIFDEVMKDIRFRYVKSLVHPGEMVGPLAAQSIGEPTTQLTLNTFHKAGTAKANATQGVPRIQELLGLTSSPKNPSNMIYFTQSVGTNKDSMIMKMKEIQKTTLRDICKAVRIYYDPNPLSSDTEVQEDREALLLYEKFSVTQGQLCASPWVMRLELDQFQMGSRGVTDMTMIQATIQANKALRIFECVNGDTEGKIVLRITFSPEIVKNALSLRFIEDKLLDTVLTGVSGIRRVFHREVKNEIVYDERVGGYVPTKQYVLDTEGTNLLDLFTKADVDATRTFSNDIHEILDVFGIEAARLAIFEEINEVFKDENVNYHHICVLVDAMTYYGRLIGADRSGMTKLDVGVLAQSSFEMTYQVLFEAAVSGEFDKLTGVSSNIMFGQKPPCGTGFVDILVDETKLPEGMEEEETGNADLEQANALVEQALARDAAEGACRLEDIEMVW